MKKYFLQKENLQEGPYSLEELQNQRSILKAEDYVWFEGISDWILIKDCEELKDLLPKIPPPFKKETAIPPPFNKNIENVSTTKNIPPPLTVNSEKNEQKTEVKKDEISNNSIPSVKENSNKTIYVLLGVAILFSILTQATNFILSFIVSLIILIGYFFGSRTLFTSFFSILSIGIIIAGVTLSFYAVSTEGQSKDLVPLGFGVAGVGVLSLIFSIYLLSNSKK